MKYLALLLVGALAFTACSKDESEVKEEKKDNIVNVDNSRPGDKNNPKPVVPKKKVLDLIAKIETYSGPRQEPIKTEIFSYDSQKRLVGISSTEPRYFTQPAMIGKGTYSTSEYVLQQEGHDSKKLLLLSGRLLSRWMVRAELPSLSMSRLLLPCLIESEHPIFIFTISLFMIRMGI